MMYIRLSLQLACTGASPQTNVMGTLNMLGLAKRQELESYLTDCDVLFFSGGGNDIAGDQFCIWL